MTRREAIESASCPRCGAAKGEKCQQGGVLLDYRICAPRKAKAETIGWRDSTLDHPYLQAARNRRNNGLPRR